MKFTAIIDKKYTVWQRLGIEFEAKNETDAKKKLKEFNGVPPDTEYLTTETLYDTEEEIDETDNGGEPVFEIVELTK